MKATEKIIIAGQPHTKTQAIQHFRGMLKRYLMNQPLEAADHAAMMDILPRHPRHADKVGCGVAEIQVCGGGRFGTRLFKIVRTDGTTETISYLVCLSPSLDDHAHDVVWAMRCEVQPQTRQYFDDSFKRSAVFCEITGDRLTPKNSHVDHIRPMTFQRLMRDFLHSKGLTMEAVAVSETAHNVTSLADRDLAAAWQQYHQTHAKLRIASKRANLKERKPAVDFRPIPTLF